MTMRFFRSRLATVTRSGALFWGRSSTNNDDVESISGIQQHPLWWLNNHDWS